MLLLFLCLCLFSFSSFRIFSHYVLVRIGPVQFPAPPADGPVESSGVIVGASGYGFVPPGSQSKNWNVTLLCRIKMEIRAFDTLRFPYFYPLSLITATAPYRKWMKLHIKIYQNRTTHTRAQLPNLKWSLFILQK